MLHTFASRRPHGLLQGAAAPPFGAARGQRRRSEGLHNSCCALWQRQGTGDKSPPPPPKHPPFQSNLKSFFRCL